MSAALGARARRIVVAAFLFFLLVTIGHTQQITLKLDDLSGTGFSVQGISASYVNSAARIDIAALNLGAQSWKNIRLDCADLRLERTVVACADGVLAVPALGEKIPLSFTYLFNKRVLDIAFKPAKDESWQVNLRPGKRGNDLKVRIDGGRLQRVAAWLPPQVPRINAGTLNGTIDYRGDGRIALKVALTGMGIADASGLHTGKKMGLDIVATAEPAAGQLRWNAALTWNTGEAYMQSVHLKAAKQRFSAEGSLDAKQMRVERGMLRYPGVGDVAFTGSYDLAAKKLVQGKLDTQAIQLGALHDLVLKPLLEGKPLSDSRTGSGRVPSNLLKLNAGVAKGVIDYTDNGRIAAKFELDGAGFSDTSGLHAGEKIGLSIAAAGEVAADHVRWNADLSWHAGEAFWQPVYLKAANHQLSAAGRWDTKQLRIERGVLRYPGIGDVTFTGAYDHAAKKMTEGSAAAQAIQVSALYESFLKPFLEGTTLSDLRTDGRISAQLQLNDKGLQRADVRLDNVSFEDRTQRRFALFEINGTVPWRADAQTRAAVSVKGGELLKMPVGAFSIPLNMNGMRFDLKQLRVPLLDGLIDVRDFVAHTGTTGWDWQFTGAVSGISMDKFTAALGVPVMHGTLAAALPMVRQVESTMRVDGALSLRVFDGTIEAKNLVLLDIFGKAPRVQADVSMQNLDLGQVTGTYSFGNITGRLDVSIAGLELVDWQPVKFDARLQSSAGEYPRKISQAAVQNISALGGAGASAAIQRSFLRFFEQFGYDKLGWGCKLQNGVCEMSGVEDRATGYVIVKGGGIPAITVIGYNRRVDWQELLNRLKRVTQGNVKAIVE